LPAGVAPIQSPSTPSSAVPPGEPAPLLRERWQHSVAVEIAPLLPGADVRRLHNSAERPLDRPSRTTTKTPPGRHPTGCLLFCHGTGKHYEKQDLKPSCSHPHTGPVSDGLGRSPSSGCSPVLRLTSGPKAGRRGFPTRNSILRRLQAERKTTTAGAQATRRCRPCHHRACAGCAQPARTASRRSTPPTSRAALWY